MKSKWNAFFSGVSVLAATVMLSVNIHSVTVMAAAPVLTVKTSAPDESIKYQDALPDAVGDSKTVSNLRIINLEMPKYGEVFDTKATVMTDEDIFWEIPVIWVDEEGNIPLICLPGKKYTPVFAFYTPTGVTVRSSSSIGGYTIKLPAFLEGIVSSEDLVMVADPQRNITYITTSALAEIGSAVSVKSSGQEGAPSVLSFSALVGFGSLDNKAYTYASYMESHNPESEGDKASEPQNHDAPVPSGEEKEPYVPVVVNDELVRIHCSNPCVKQYGEENLRNLLDTIIQVIQPQAVYQLMTGFPSYTSAAEADVKELGENIGLYVYSHKYTIDTKKDLEALAFVDDSYTNWDKGEFGYYIGVDVESVFTYDEGKQEYIISEYDRVTLENTFVHELMHAFMDDYTRTGMAGIGDYTKNPEITNEENKFPNWFIEGSASAVENVFSYRIKHFNEMKGTNEEGGYNEKYDADILKEYYESPESKASINSKDKYYDDGIKSAYVSGYLAVLYMSNLASDYLNKNDTFENHQKTVIEDENGNKKYNNKAFKEGFDYILELLHDGTALNDVINIISDGAYTDTKDFQDSFISGEGEEDEGKSLDFCVDFLNYLQKVSDDIKKIPGFEESDANGSILLEFDTVLQSPLYEETPTYMLPQVIYNIADSMDYVTSTVDDKTAITSGGLVCPGERTDIYGEDTNTSGDDTDSYEETTIPIAAKDGNEAADPDAEDKDMEALNEEENTAETSANTTADEPLDTVSKVTDNTTETIIAESGVPDNSEKAAEIAVTDT
ncbi:MAG: hypothetical protein J6N21_10620, partial [Butyrivibrio sp.]|nr:hypothetical protein [Butyrivibrio sp.]